MKTSLTTILSLTGIVAAIMAFYSCTKTNDNNDNLAVSGLMAFNLAPDMKGIGITLSGNTLPGTPLLYTNYTGAYLRAYPGTRSVMAYDYYMNSLITSSAAYFEPGKFYSLFVVGANDNYANLVVRDNFDSLSSADGKAYIRYVNAIPDSTISKVSISAGGKDEISEDSHFTKSSEFVAVTPGQVNIQLNHASTQVMRTITLQQSKIYTVLLTGLPGSADPSATVQIKYIENGKLKDKPENKIMASSNASRMN